MVISVVYCSMKTKEYSFYEFAKAVDNDCWMAMGMSYLDLPDFPIRDYFDGGIDSGKEFDYSVKMCVADIMADNGLEPEDYLV